MHGPGTRWSDVSAACRVSAQTILLAVLTAAPWMFGGHEFWAQWWLSAGVGVAGGLTVLSRLADADRQPSFLPTLIVPAIGALVLGAVQLAPWPGIASEFGEAAVFSRYPEATRLALAKLSFGAIALLTAVGLFESHRARRCLFAVLALNGGALAAFGIAQKVSWNEKLYWTYGLTKGGQPFASYVNRNSAAGYLNLCLAGAVGLLIWTVVRQRGWSPAEDEPWGRRILRALVRVDGLQAVAGTCLLLIVAGVFASVSRSGIGACVLAVTGAVAIQSRQRGRAALIAVVGLAGVLGLLATAGLLQPLEARFTTDRVLDDGRFEHWQDSLQTARHSGVFGYGCGTYRYAYMRFQQQPTSLWFVNADNQYLEGWVEGGLLGLGLIVIALALLIAAVWRLVAHRALSEDRDGDGMAAVGVIVVVAQTAQAYFDFGLTMPANLLTFAVLSGVIVSRAAQVSPARSAVAWPMPAFGQVGVWLLLLANGGVAFSLISRAAEAEALRPPAQKLDIPDMLRPGELAAAIRDATHAAAIQPGDAALHAELADLLIYEYRLASLPAASGNWERTDLAVLHARANDLVRNQETAALEKLRSAKPVQKSLKPARAHLLAARAACPILPRVDLRIAALSFLEGDDPRGLAEIARAVRLTPADPDVCFSAGVLAIGAGELAIGHRYWKQGLTLTHKHLPEALRRLKEYAPLSEAWVDDLLPDDTTLLVELARQFVKDPALKGLASAIARRAESLLEAGGDAAPNGERAQLRALVRIVLDRPSEAAADYEIALRRQPAQADWRLEYARLLLSLGRSAEAEKQALWLVRHDPERQEYRDLLEDVLRRR